MILKAQIVAIVFSIIIGSILHFTFKLSNNNKFVAMFSSINESTWEHLKLSFFAIILVSIIEYFFIINYANNYIEAKTIAAILSIIIITVLFYVYTRILEKNNFVIDISIFMISIILSELVAYKIMNLSDISTDITKIISIICILVLVILFGVFTFYPPKMKYFRDPLTGKYGMEK